jgi:Peptidase of plants and bacteria
MKVIACSRNYLKVLTSVAVVLLTGCQSAPHQKTGNAAAGGHVTVTINHNDNDTASPEFKFQAVPPPAKTDAATTARFIIVNGEIDPNSGGLDTLHDGEVPTEADQPLANFFFNAGTDGGRLLVDLGKVIEIKEVNTYSWHPNTRGPQVYELYASDGSASNFNPQPKRGADPKSCGWKLIASIDTRPKDDNDNGGGQYGVSIADTAGAIGNYRYLLFDMSDTEEDDNFGNTFYSEIDVIDTDTPVVAPESADQNVSPRENGSGQQGTVARGISSQGEPTVFVIPTTNGKCKITIDTKDAPQLADWADEKLAPVLAGWYPKIVALLPSPGFTAPTHYTVTVRPMNGVAYTTGTHVFVSEKWIEDQMYGQAIGSLVHETVHVVQQYGWGRRHNPDATRSPGWLVEGMADYVRWFLYEPQSHGADIVWMRRQRDFNPRYDDSYRITANFLNWVTRHYDKHIVTQLNAAMREGKYHADLWQQNTGKTVQQLGQEWKSHIEAELAAKPASDKVEKQST